MEALEKFHGVLPLVNDESMSYQSKTEHVFSDHMSSEND